MAALDNDALLEAELRRDERAVNHVYPDSLGWLTIGVGRLVDPRKGGSLSDDEVSYLLRNDIARIAAELDEKLPWWRTLDPVRQRVIQNMAFNLGIDGLLGFNNTLAAVRTGQWAKAAAGMRASKWAEQVKGRAVRLSLMMQTGVAP